MKLLLAIVSISVFLIGDCRRVHFGGERADSVGKDQTVTSPVNVIEENLSTMTINNILEEMINQETDAASPDDDEDSYAGDHDSSSAASIFDSKNATVEPPQLWKNGKAKPQGLRRNGNPRTPRVTRDGEKMNRIVGQSGIISYKGPCPGHFDDLGGTCFWFSSNRGLKFTWEKSRKFCQAMGDMLGLEIDLADLSDEKNYYSHILLMEKCAEKGASHAWLGATDEASEGHWIWAHSGRTLSIKNPLWAPGEPNAGKSGNCMPAWITGSHKRAYFADDPCRTEFVFVCQIF